RPRPWHGSGCRSCWRMSEACSASSPICFRSCARKSSLRYRAMLRSTPTRLLSGWTGERTSRLSKSISSCPTGSNRRSRPRAEPALPRREDCSFLLMEAIFRVDGADVVTSPHAAGPWDPNMQHGGAPASLVVWAAERIATAAPMQVARVTIDLMRPVPVAPLTLQTEVLREGRKIQLCAVRLLADGKLTVGATVLKIRR